jgi:DNA-binding CsgD family transcriptional regulator
MPRAYAQGSSVRWAAAHGEVGAVRVSIYHLSEREQEVTRQVLQGRSTREIAAELFIAPVTVQEHLKRIFDKTGVRSRRDLVGKVFFTHYEPRVRDNEARAIDGRPLRGGPVSVATVASALDR